MYCRKCGTVVPDDSIFCQKCGDKIMLNTSQTIEVDFDTFMTNQSSSKIIDINHRSYNNSDDSVRQDTTNKNTEEYSKFESNENNTTDKSTTPSTDSESVKDSFFKGLLSIIVIIIIIAIANTLIKNYKSSGSIDAAISDTVETLSNLGDRTTDNSKRKMEFYNIAKEIIRDELATPSTAIFPAFNMKFISFENSLYTINAYVDHENIMGAKIRSYFIIEINKTDNGYNYKIIKLG